ncbi:MAG: hypothetical protein EA402_08225 [Planctomycetota bacterium]|nr:MAG: hypothetical protein EA402_08225 [Planctomycetota bacterium]
MVDPTSANSSSYSDPFYDKLDAIFSWLGRNWLIVVALILAVIMGSVIVGYRLRANPDAVSATALYQARQAGDDGEALRLLSENEEHTPEARARAALDLAQARQVDEHFEAAERFARQAVSLAEASGIRNLRAASEVTLASILEQAGQLRDARRLYQAIAERYRGELPAFVIAAEAAQALLAATIAEDSEDSDEARSLRLEALRILRDFADLNSGIDAPVPVLQASIWRYFDLRRNFPDLAHQLDRELGLIDEDEAGQEALIETDAEAASISVETEDENLGSDGE